MVSPKPFFRSVAIWLFLGCALVFMQVVIGGVTRLTGSGLSITKWEIVVGTLPPLNETQWDRAFEQYRQTPQYHQINYDMTMEEFKFIYFWEYFHRFWARWMGLVFLFPFLYFNKRGMIDRPLKRSLMTVVVWAAIIAAFGWIMVASGLIDKPYVSPLKLSIHLSLALGLFGYLVHIAIAYAYRPQASASSPVLRYRGYQVALVWLFLQIFLGGIMSGMKAGLAYNTWPDLHGEWIPSVILQQPWSFGPFLYYDAADVTGKAVIQVLHRSVAYLLAAWVMFLVIRDYGKAIAIQQKALLMLALALLVQVVLGIVTVLNCTGHIPVLWGELHQIGAMLLLCSLIFAIFHLAPRPEAGKA